MHTDETLDVMEQVTVALGQAMRTFQTDTCSSFTTTELPRETEARNRRTARAASKQGQGTLATSSKPPQNSITTGRSARRAKFLNLRTYKMHALGDYTSQIREYGTTDSYSTQTVRATSLYRDSLTISLRLIFNYRESSNIALAKDGIYGPVARNILLSSPASIVAKHGFVVFVPNPP